MNEFKLSALRQFGSENISFTATIHSDSTILTDDELAAQVKQIDTVITKAFLAVCDREISEKGILLDQSTKRQAANEALDKRLNEEVDSANKMRKGGTKLEKLIGGKQS